MARTVVCISHATGAGGEEVGRLVAERLGFLYVDEDIVARAAAKGELDAAEVADEERRKSLVARALNALGEGGGESWAAAWGAFPTRTADALTSDEIRALIRETIEQTAARGNAVIVAHAASHAVGARAGTLRVLVTASPNTRSDRVATVEGLDQEQARRAVKDSDRGRMDYLRRFYSVAEELPTHYDLVVNTDALSHEEAAELVVHAASR